MALSPWARSALIEVSLASTAGIVLSVRAVANRLRCHRDTAGHALQELIDKGFIDPRIKGAFTVKFRHATEWRLTDRRCDATGARQSQAFLKWRGPDIAPAKENEAAETQSTVLIRRTVRS